MNQPLVDTMNIPYYSFCSRPLIKNLIKMKDSLADNDSGAVISKITEYAAELEKGKAHIIVEIIEYLPNAVVSRTIIKKITGNITVSSFDAGEELAEKLSPFDAFIQIIDGSAELSINDKIQTLKLGDGIIIPAHAKHHFNANVQFKMISTVIKSAYEDF